MSLRILRLACRGRYRHGFSLSEIVFAILLLSLVSITLMGVIPAAQNATAEANNRATAGRLADSAMDQARNGLSLVTSGPLPPVTLNDVDYTLDLTVVNVTPAPAPQSISNPKSNPTSITPVEPGSCRKITVVVRWKDRKGQDHNLQAARVVFKP